jgi:hypothetical protein
VTGGVTVWNGPEPNYSVAGRDVTGRLVQSVDLADSAAFDAFGRFRVSQPLTLFESSFEYDLQANWFEPVVANGGAVAHNADTRSAVLTAGTAANSSAMIGTRQWWPYEKGKSQLIKTTFVLGAAVANVTKRVGYFDDANGVYLRQDGDGLALVLRSSTSGTLEETVVPQVDWSADPLNGTGASGITLDPELQQIFVVDAQFLGAGRIRAGFNVDGVTVVAHEFRNANRNPVAPYMQTFNLPVRFQVEATGATAGATFQAICCDVESEGGVGSPNGHTFAAANPADVATSTTRAHVLSIRPALTYNGITNRQFILPVEITATAASQTVLVEVFHGSTLTGGTWGTATPTSAVEVGTGQTISAVGKPVDAFFVTAAGVTRGAASSTVADTFPITLNAAGTAATPLTIAATTLTGNGSVRAAIRWKEIR